MTEQENMTDDELNSLFLSAGSADEYRLKKLSFVPDVIYDIGADVGSITMFAAANFPLTKIVAVEPNPWSFKRLVTNAQQLGYSNVFPVQKALGQGEMFEPQPTTPPLHWMVVNRDHPCWHENLQPSKIQSVSLAELYNVHRGKKYVVKMDCESAELFAITEKKSKQVILNSGYFAAELHVWAQCGSCVPHVAETLYRFIFELAQSHTVWTKCYGACIHVWAKNRKFTSGEATTNDTTN